MRNLLESWTVKRATGAGIVAGAIALVLWPLHALFAEPLHLPFAGALAATSFCGISILLITVLDLKFRRGRGFKLRGVAGGPEPQNFQTVSSNDKDVELHQVQVQRE